MRINLVTPFAEKDAAKALGARWDSTKKLWYIVDVADLTPFLRWIPDMDAATVDALANPASPAQTDKSAIRRSPGIVTTSTVKVAHCGCTEHAWEHCVHTR
ncbi:MAG: DUF5710 domain-containing protein [Rhodoferax sp.]